MSRINALIKVNAELDKLVSSDASSMTTTEASGGNLQKKARTKQKKARTEQNKAASKPNKAATTWKKAATMQKQAAAKQKQALTKQKQTETKRKRTVAADQRHTGPGRTELLTDHEKIATVKNDKVTDSVEIKKETKQNETRNSSEHAQ